jgi:hypothetical protein
MAYARQVTPSRARALLRPHLGRVRFATLATTGILVAHDAVFLAQNGPGAAYESAMARTAHGYWPAFLLFTLLVGALGTLTAVRALARLGRMVRGLPGDTRPPRNPRYWSEVRRLWPRLFAIVLLGFLVQENVEHLASGSGLPGLWVLSAPHYPLAVPAILAVTALLAAAGGWLQWRREVLIGRLRAAHAAALRHGRQLARMPHGRWALLAALLANDWALLRRDAERAPPAGCAA